MELRTPYETTKFRNLHVPNYCTIFLTPNTETYSSHLIKGLTKSKLPATCQISSLRIKTLDQHRYEVIFLTRTYIQKINYILAHRIGISEILLWVRKSYLTHAILLRLSLEGYIHWLYWNSRIWSPSDVIVMLK